MAYPTVSSAFGFEPINELNGLPYAGATRQIPIPYAYSTSIFNGDLVELAGGAINITGMSTSTTSTARAGQIGVFVGCSYTNPSTGQKLFAQYWPASTAANDAVAYVVDDPSAVFKVVMVGQRNEFYQKQTDAQMQSVDNNFMRENDSRMPLFKDRQSKVTFGRGSS